MKKVLLVGVGLIGGSFSLGLKTKKTGHFEFGGNSRTQATLDKAEELGIITQKFIDLAEGIAWADWIVLSVPVDIIKRMLPGILDQLQPHQLVIDFGSTKGAICEEVANHSHRSQFLAAHPIAGTEYSGPDAAFASLYEEKCLIVCEEEKTDDSLKQEFLSACESLGFFFVNMGAEAHDRHLAYISHLSHVTSYSLSNTVLEKERNGEVILELAGSGFASTVRLAKSSPEMWTPIFLENKKMILEGIDGYINQLTQLRNMLNSDDSEGIYEFLEAGRAIKNIIK